MTAPTQPRPQVTDEERRMLAMLAAGYTHARIGRHLGITIHTASVRVSRVYLKLGAVNAANAVAIAIRDGLISANQEADQQ